MKSGFSWIAEISTGTGFGELFPSQTELVLLDRSQRKRVAWPCSLNSALDKSVCLQRSHATQLHGSEMPVSLARSYSSKASSLCLEPLLWSLWEIWWLKLNSSSWQLKAASAPGLLPFYEGFIHKVSKLILTQKAKAVLILAMAAIYSSHYTSCLACMIKLRYSTR